MQNQSDICEHFSMTVQAFDPVSFPAFARGPMDRMGSSTKKEAPASRRGKRLAMEGPRSGRRSGQCRRLSGNTAKTQTGNTGP